MVALLHRRARQRDLRVLRDGLLGLVDDGEAHADAALVVPGQLRAGEDPHRMRGADLPVRREEGRVLVGIGLARPGDRDAPRPLRVRLRQRVKALVAGDRSRHRVRDLALRVQRFRVARELGVDEERGDGPGSAVGVEVAGSRDDDGLALYHRVGRADRVRLARLDRPVGRPGNRDRGVRVEGRAIRGRCHPSTDRQGDGQDHGGEPPSQPSRLTLLHAHSHISVGGQGPCPRHQHFG